MTKKRSKSNPKKTPLSLAVRAFFNRLSAPPGCWSEDKDPFLFLRKHVSAYGPKSPELSELEQQVYRYHASPFVSRGRSIEYDLLQTKRAYLQGLFAWQKRHSVDPTMTVVELEKLSIAIRPLAAASH